MHARHVVGVRLSATCVIGRDQQLIVRDEARGSVDELGVLHQQPRSREARPQLRAHELVEAGARDGDTEQEEPEKHGQLVCVAEPSQIRRQLRRARQEVVAGREPLLDPLRLVARIPKEPREVHGRPRALRARGVGSPGRRNGTNGSTAVRPIVSR